ncbi:biotin--[acetyl-CoA-carboxylase] ligase [Streptomyces halobius]|uniref:biotin--[biotin carboxyl-carrier protein] ligase n=1 Tax=Streptomyces halobius TaxID=2879846 RepID=A0ABY4M6L1_9ACTN|nr:biotin--[acetyl-CoA-carboxylase] ligase [Streptomyces halobius]UQA93399.1 biotin--[acetyl-CoA-carboxylase] ligase [Streptomyces halobius]
MTPQPPKNRDKSADAEGRSAGRPGSGSARAGRWTDLARPPLNEHSLRRGMLRPGSLWSALDVVAATGSTNTDLAERAAEGTAAEGAVLVAEEQSAGRGRLDRHWSAPPRSGLFFSVYLTPRVPMARWGWLPLLTGVATAAALSREAGVDTALKWPNDLLVIVGGAERKAGGILAERAGQGVVIGIGLNVTLSEDELPVPTAGSLTLAGARSTDRDILLRAVLRSLEHWYREWQAVDGEPAASGLLEAYATGCATLGRSVRAELPGDTEIVGEAVAIDGDGRLVVATAGGVQRPIAAGDIVHLRAADAGEAG